MRYLILLFTVLLFTNCKHRSASGEIIDEFKKVNESLERSNKVLEQQSNDDLYELIKSKAAANPELAKAAGDLYQSADSAYRYLEKLRDILRTADEDDLSIATKLIQNSASGDTLAVVLLDVADKARRCPLTDGTHRQLLENLNALEVFHADDSWKKTYFEKTPAIAAMTILAKFQNDTRNIASIAMRDIARQLNK